MIPTKLIQGVCWYLYLCCELLNNSTERNVLLDQKGYLQKHTFIYHEMINLKGHAHLCLFNQTIFNLIGGWHLQWMHTITQSCWYIHSYIGMKLKIFALKKNLLWIYSIHCLFKINPTWSAMELDFNKTQKYAKSKRKIYPHVEINLTSFKITSYPGSVKIQGDRTDDVGWIVSPLMSRGRAVTFPSWVGKCSCSIDLQSTQQKTTQIVSAMFDSVLRIGISS